jgi:integrase
MVGPPGFEPGTNELCILMCYESRASRGVQAIHLILSPAVVLFDTGMRPEECHRMRWEHLRWRNDRYGTIRIAFGKTKAARRTLPMTPRVRAILEIRWQTAGKPEEGWVWPAPTLGGHVNHDSLKKAHAKALRLSKVRRFAVYSIRHTMLTRLGESGCDVWTLARIAGHSSIAIPRGMCTRPAMQSSMRWRGWVGTILGIAAKSLSNLRSQSGC